MLRAFRWETGRGTLRSDVGYLIVFVISLAVAGAVFYVTLRGIPLVGASGWSWPSARGDRAAADEGPPEPAPGMSYVPVAEERHDWQARMTGVLGLLVSVAVAAIALAVSLYAVGALIARLFAGDGTGSAGA
jgi:hypothetical protein